MTRPVVLSRNANPRFGRRTNSSQRARERETLKDLRRAARLAPQELATRPSTVPPDLLHRIELRSDMRISTLRRHVETIGGRLVLIAELPDRPGIFIDIRAMSIEQVEWEHIQRVLREHHHNISATARALSMHRRTLQRKLQKPPRKA